MLPAEFYVFQKTYDFPGQEPTPFRSEVPLADQWMARFQTLPDELQITSVDTADASRSPTNDSTYGLETQYNLSLPGQTVQKYVQGSRIAMIGMTNLEANYPDNLQMSSNDAAQKDKSRLDVNPCAPESGAPSQQSSCEHWGNTGKPQKP